MVRVAAGLCVSVPGWVRGVVCGRAGAAVCVLGWVPAGAVFVQLGRLPARVVALPGANVYGGACRPVGSRA